MQAFFDEVSIGAIHNIVLADVIDFETLYRAARNWDTEDVAWAEGDCPVTWIQEMADLNATIRHDVCKPRD